MTTKQNPDCLDLALDHLSISDDIRLSFEKLPVLLLDTIFQYVQAPDLLNLCRISKDLYWPAVARLYKNITVTGEDEMVCASDFLSRDKINHGTVMREENVAKLVEAVRKKKALAGLVKGLVLERISNNVEYKVTTMMLLPLLPNLIAYHNFTSIEPQQDPGWELQSVTCFTSHVPKLLPSLTELRLIDYDEEPKKSIDFYRKAARNLVELGGHVTLRRLEFSYHDPLDTFDNPFGPFDVEPYAPNWMIFLIEINLLGVKLKLDALGICGDIKPHTVSATLSLLRESIDLSILKKLVLNYLESTHEHHEPPILMMITQCTPMLESLAINHTMDDCLCQVRAIQASLAHNIRDQLKELFVLVKSPKPDALAHRKAVLQAVAETQKNLVKLRFEDGHDALETSPALFQAMKMLGSYMQGDWYDEIMKRDMFPQILADPHLRPVLDEEHVSVVSLSINHIHSWFTRRVFRSVDVAHLLPNLSQLYVGRMYFDMKQHGIFVNADTILFEEEEKEAH